MHYGWPSSPSAIRRLKKRLLRRQELAGVEFLTRMGGGPTSPLVTTIALLRKHCPEMVDNAQEALDLVADIINRLKSEIAELKLENQRLRHRVFKLEHPKLGQT